MYKDRRTPEPMLEFAVQQLTGFNLAKRGFSITDLIQSMGLTADEWWLIRSDCEWLSPSQMDEIHEYFYPTTTK